MTRLFFLLAVLFLCVGPAKADTIRLDTLAKIPVQHEGRVKPLDSFARNVYKYLSGHEAGALPWLTETLFNPARAEQIPAIKINNPNVLQALDLNMSGDKLFSYRTMVDALAKQQSTILSVLEKDQSEWLQQETDLIIAQQKTVLLGDLLSSLSLFLPLSGSLPETIAPQNERHNTYFETIKHREKLDKAIADLISRKGTDLNDYNDEDMQIAHLSFSIKNLDHNGRRSQILRVMPVEGQKEWASPWQLILTGQSGPETRLPMQALSNMALHFHDEDFESFNKASETFLSYSSQMIVPMRITAEIIYNYFNPHKISAFLYGITIMLLILGAVFIKLKSFRLPFYTLAIGSVLHTLGIIMRVYILQRPPVSTLHESIIFVGLVAVLFFLYQAWRDKNLLWLSLGGALGVILQVAAFTYEPDGDSFMMLSAVLNTNFWLATHVICITAGYAFCLITSATAHTVLITRKTDTPLFSQMHTLALIALLFTAVGTVLGGIWADQSWGRFWGWDPKENGALLIVLWLIWILHGRLSRQISDMWIAAGLAYLSVVVGISWFGVNLLNIGLHAYGFTDKAAYSLSAFVAVETVFVAFLVWRFKQLRAKA